MHIYVYIYGCPKHFACFGQGKGERETIGTRPQKTRIEIPSQWLVSSFGAVCVCETAHLYPVVLGNKDDRGVERVPRGCPTPAESFFVGSYAQTPNQNGGVSFCPPKKGSSRNLHSCILIQFQPPPTKTTPAKKDPQPRIRKRNSCFKNPPPQTKPKKGRRRRRRRRRRTRCFSFFGFL